MDVPKAGCLVKESRERLLAHPSKAHNTVFEILFSSHGHSFPLFFFLGFLSSEFQPCNLCIFISQFSCYYRRHHRSNGMDGNNNNNNNNNNNKHYRRPVLTFLKSKILPAGWESFLVARSAFEITEFSKTA